MARSCIFCGGSPTTKEHVIPEWIARAMEPGEVTVTIQGDIAPASWKAANSFGMVSKLVCRGCNGGWLSDLENRAKSSLLPLIQGRRVVLDPWHQRDIAAWVWKTAMTAERPARVTFFRPSERTALMMTGEPPRSHVLLNAGRYVGRQRPGKANYRIGTARADGRPIGASFVFVIQLGAVVFELLCVRLDSGSIRFTPERRLDRLWPPETWLPMPSASSVDDLEYQRILDRFS